jgi:hypothetical protein
VFGSELGLQGSLVMRDLPEVSGSHDISRNFPKVTISASNCFYFQEMSMLPLLLRVILVCVTGLCVVYLSSIILYC